MFIYGFGTLNKNSFLNPICQRLRLSVDDPLKEKLKVSGFDPSLTEVLN